MNIPSPDFQPLSCNEVIIDILKRRLPNVLKLLELPQDTDGFSYLIKRIEMVDDYHFVKVVFTTDFNANEYVWYFRGSLLND